MQSTSHEIRSGRRPHAISFANERRRTAADTALRLAPYFGNGPEFWLNLQTHDDIKTVRKNLSAKAIARIRAHRAA